MTSLSAAAFLALWECPVEPLTSASWAVMTVWTEGSKYPHEAARPAAGRGLFAGEGPPDEARLTHPCAAHGAEAAAVLQGRSVEVDRVGIARRSAATRPRCAGEQALGVGVPLSRRAAFCSLFAACSLSVARRSSGASDVPPPEARASVMAASSATQSTSGGGDASTRSSSAIAAARRASAAAAAAAVRLSLA